MTEKRDYDADQVTVLHGRETDNSVDEAMPRHASEITLRLHESDDSIGVPENARVMRCTSTSNPASADWNSC